MRRSCSFVRLSTATRRRRQGARRSALRGAWPPSPLGRRGRSTARSRRDAMRSCALRSRSPQTPASPLGEPTARPSDRNLSGTRRCSPVPKSAADTSAKWSARSGASIGSKGSVSQSSSPNLARRTVRTAKRRELAVPGVHAARPSLSVEEVEEDRPGHEVVGRAFHNPMRAQSWMTCRGCCSSFLDGPLAQRQAQPHEGGRGHRGTSREVV